MPNSECLPADNGMNKSSDNLKLESPGARTVWSGGVTSDQELVTTSGSRSKRCASRGRLKVYIGLLLLLTVLLLAACGFLLYSYIRNLLGPTDLCMTRECMKSAAMIVETMDSTANPCEDFYQFACGNFKKEHPIPDTGFNEDWFSNRNNHMMIRIREYLEQNDTSDEPRAVQKARVMFRACKDIETLERLGLSPLMKFLDHLGLPRTPPLRLTGGEISWTEAAAHIKRHTDKDIFLGVDVMADPVNNTINLLSLGLPGDTSPLPSHRDHNNIKRPPLLTLLATAPENSKKVAWREYIVQTMGAIFEYNNQTVTKSLNSSLYDAAQKIIDFTKTIMELKSNFTSTDPTKDDLPKRMWVSELQKVTDKVVSSYAPSQVNWTQYLGVLVADIEGLDLDLQNHDKLAVYNLEYLQALMKLLAETPKSTLLLTVWWEVVYDLVPYTTNTMRDLRSDFQEKTLGETAEPSRPSHCAYVVQKLLDIAVGTLATTESFLETTKPKVYDMIDDIQDSLLRAVEATTWIDTKTKAAIKDKVSYIKRRIGFPEWMLDNSEVDDYYDTLEMYEETHLENVLTYLGKSVYSNFKNLHTPNDFNNTGFNPLEVNAAYSVTDNTIFVPLGMIQFPFFNLGLDVLNYGAIGTILGHELVHSLDTDGRKYDKYGNYRMWWTNQSIEAFTKRVSCLVDKYSLYYVEDVEAWVDGNLTLGENIADNGGLRAAKWGYDKRASRLGKESRLPGLTQFSTDQLFYLAFANIWCEHWSTQSMAWSLENEHAPNYVRVMAMLSNSPEFGKAWDCPVNSEMNPKDKCQVW